MPKENTFHRIDKFLNITTDLKLIFISENDRL